ncbi:MAG: hypothetical protein ACFE89_09290 [Candidatus Hodarchaeota archaeon]
MSKPVDLKALERQAYLTYHGDGIIDLFLGFVIVWLSVLAVILPEFFIFLVGSFVALFPSYTSAKKSFTIPRMGYVEFSATRQWKTKQLFVVINLVTVMGVVLGLLAWLVPLVSAFIVTYFLLILGGAGGGVFLLIAYVTGIKRFYGYGLAIFSGFVIAFLFSLSVLIPLCSLGAIMITYGSVLLYRFTRKYPKGERDEAQEPY